MSGYKNVGGAKWCCFLRFCSPIIMLGTSIALCIETIEALKVLQQEGFANAIMTSVDACVSKANSLK